MAAHHPQRPGSTRPTEKEALAAADTPPAHAPLPSYTLSTVCPACDSPTYRLACKVRCPRCGFMWDCSEL